MCTCSKCEFNSIKNGNLTKSTRNKWKQFLSFRATLKLYPLVRNYISANSADYHKLWNVERNFCHMFDWLNSIPNKHRILTKIEFLVFALNTVHLNCDQSACRKPQKLFAKVELIQLYRHKYLTSMFNWSRISYIVFIKQHISIKYHFIAGILFRKYQKNAFSWFQLNQWIDVSDTNHSIRMQKVFE